MWYKYGGNKYKIVYESESIHVRPSKRMWTLIIISINKKHLEIYASYLDICFTLMIHHKVMAQHDNAIIFAPKTYDIKYYIVMDDLIGKIESKIPSLKKQSRHMNKCVWVAPLHFWHWTLCTMITTTSESMTNRKRHGSTWT